MNKWLRAIKRLFSTLATPVEYHITFTAHRFTGVVITWWETLSYTIGTEEMTWDVFENLFREAYFNSHHQRAIVDEFDALYQRDMTVTEYYNLFIELAQYCMAENVDTLVLISRFINRLQQPIVDKIIEHQLTTLMDC